MAQLLERHRDKIALLVEKSLGVISDAFVADRSVPLLGGAVDLGPDTFARLAGVKRLIEMVQACRADAGEQKPLTITWEMFLNLYQEAAK